MSYNLILSALPLCLYVEQLCSNMLCAFLPVRYSTLCMCLVIRWWLILALCLGTVTLQRTGYITKRHTFPAVCHSMIYGMTERLVCRFRMSESANLGFAVLLFLHQFGVVNQHILSCCVFRAFRVHDHEAYGSVFLECELICDESPPCGD